MRLIDYSLLLAALSRVEFLIRILSCEEFILVLGISTIIVINVLLVI